jgi:uncharacterized protein (TIGR03067 family)
LAERLKRHGIVMPAALSALLVSDCFAGAGPAPELVTATAAATAEVAAGNTAAASAKAVTLGKGGMFLTKLQWTTTLVVLLGIAACAAAGFHFQFLAGEEPPAAKAEAPTPKPDDPQPQTNQGTDDAQRLQGEWQAVDGEKGGKPITEDPKDFRITFKGDEFIGFDGKMKFKLDTGKSPRELDIRFVDGKLKGNTLPMIYAFEKDELKLCFPLGPGIPRPKEFKTKLGSNLLLLVLRRTSKEPAAAKGPDGTVQRQWLRNDAAPDGNYQLSYIQGTSEQISCLIKLETKGTKQSASLVGADEDEQMSAVRLEVPPSPSSEAQARGAPIRLVCTTARGNLVFDGRFRPPSLEARGYLEQNGIVLPATLIATDLPKLKFTNVALPVSPLQEARRQIARVIGLQQRAELIEDAKEKADYQQQAAAAEKAALTKLPRLFREGFEKDADNRLVFDAALDAARFAAKYRIPPDQLRAMIVRADQTAATYGRFWQREFSVRIAAALAPQKEYAPLALDIATRLEKELVPGDPAALRQGALKALAAAEASIGTPAADRETRARLLARAEEELDREYRAKVPFKPVAFAGRKSQSDRAVVLELFTGTQCPPCVAASVAFDALHETYRPSGWSSFNTTCTFPVRTR